MDDYIDSNESDVRKVDERPSVKMRKLSGGKRSAHRAHPIDSMHNTHSHGGVARQTSEVGVRARILVITSTRWIDPRILKVRLTRRDIPYPVNKKLMTNAGNGGPIVWIAYPTATLHEAVKESEPGRG